MEMMSWKFGKGTQNKKKTDNLLKLIFMLDMSTTLREKKLLVGNPVLPQGSVVVSFQLNSDHS